VVLTVLSSFLRQSCLVFTNVTSALEVFLNVMRYINPRFTYLLSYVLSLSAAPEFVQRLNVFEEVEEGGRVTFECQVRAFPRPIVKWFKDDVEISSLSAEDGRLSAEEWPADTAGSGSSLLRLCIRDADKEDEGAYRCKAENEEGVAATTGYLSVAGIVTSKLMCYRKDDRAMRPIYGCIEIFGTP